MHHTLKSFFVLFVLSASLLSSCTFSRASVRIIRASDEGEDFIINTETVNFKNLKKEFEEELNEEAKEETKSIITEFLSKTEKEKPLYEKASLNLAQDIKFNDKDIISIVGEGSEFTNGVHPRLFRTVKNINTKTNSKIRLSDLFLTEEYKKVIEREIEKIIDNNPEEYNDLWKKPIVEEFHEESFYFSPDGIVIFYPPYELSYYAKGFVEFLIPYNAFFGHYKEEYKIF